MWATFCMHVIFNVIKYTIIIIYRIGKKSCVVIVVLCFYNIDGGNIISQLLLLPWLLLVGNTQPRPETAKDLFNHPRRNNRQLFLRISSFTVLKGEKERGNRNNFIQLSTKKALKIKFSCSMIFLLTYIIILC